jgi:hypothetical protein
MTRPSSTGMIAQSSSFKASNTFLLSPFYAAYALSQGFLAQQFYSRSFLMCLSEAGFSGESSE